ncbi:MAG: diacylglycerol kinase family lipid kinase [Clostridia bacterium]|nr:diacylglycerol kinase family lipid kinase [Clostridia bacterium]
MKKLLLIVNPVAGKLIAKTEFFSIVDLFCGAGYTVTTQITQFAGHGAKLAKEAYDKGYESLVCCGGDGTLNEVVTGILQANKPLPLGYIPTGSTNDFARTLKIPISPVFATELILKNKTISIDAGCFNSSRYFAYIASFGAFSSVSYDASQEAKNKFGHFAYLIEGLKNIPLIKPYSIRLTADGEKMEGDFIFGAVTNTTSVAGIVRIKSSIVDLQDGLFEVILVKNPRTAIDFNKIISGITNSNFDNDMFLFFKAKDIEFTFPKKMYWTLDGEKADGGKIVSIHNLSNALTIYQ